MTSLKTVLLIPDTHRPFHHKKAYGLMIDVARAISPDAIYILGDYADFFAVNSHQKDPRVIQMLIDEVEDVNVGLDELDELFPEAKKVYIEGNHEYRLERHLQNKAPELFGLVDCKTLFKIHLRPGWTWIPYGPSQRTRVLDSHLVARHEPLGNGAKTTASRALCSVVYGHVHKIESAYTVGLEGKQHVAFSCGWLGDQRKDLVFGYARGQWQLGFSIVRVDPKTGLFYFDMVPILSHGAKLSCVVNGRLFTR